MFRKMLLVLLALFVAVLVFDCQDQEKEQLKQDNSELAQKVDVQSTTIHDMSTEVMRQRDSLLASRHERDSLSGLLVAAQNKLANANAVNRKQRAANDSLKVLADSLPGVEQQLAETSRDLQEILHELSDVRATIGMLTRELEAKGALLDTVHVFYDVQKHNANRGWLSKVFASGKWGLPSDEPDFLKTPAITANPAAKPEPEKKPSRKRR